MRCAESGSEVRQRHACDRRGKGLPGNMFGDWYQKNHISMDGLIQKDEKTPYNVIQYF